MKKSPPIHEFFAAPLYTYGNALINWQGQPTQDLTVYAHNYRRAAMCLVSMYQQRIHGTIDEGALPILFLYRHAIELYLKAIVYKAAVVTINEMELKAALPKLWREHSLLALAEMAKPIISVNSGELLAMNGELDRRILDIASRIDAVDSGSYTFRYPVNSRGTGAIPYLFMTNVFVFSREVEGMLDDMAQFCRHLESKRIESSGQIKLALHGLHTT
ncbi:hypothetical protein FHW58_003159 [Duganella sp. 1224]|uniref:hypothetical protein n=1 Tax=Duganella sp. 1224 TaxID=2587052 RepID=UPI0015C8204F|nr:hypothetical protein [Duganella sp. 1224]NYE61952.1 hypothetical protein [Duganella sp. 1224]